MQHKRHVPASAPTTMGTTRSSLPPPDSKLTIEVGAAVGFKLGEMVGPCVGESIIAVTDDADTDKPFKPVPEETELRKVASVFVATNFEVKEEGVNDELMLEDTPTNIDVVILTLVDEARPLLLLSSF